MKTNRFRRDSVSPKPSPAIEPEPLGGRSVQQGILWVLILLVLVPSVAMANYWDDFKKAREAVEAKRWQEAEKLLRSAINDEPEPKRRPLGARYTPYYYLGVVLQERGDCRGALEAWKTSEQFGIVKPNSDESSDRAKRKARCEQDVADARTAKTEVDQTVNRGRSALDTVDGLSRRPALTDVWSTGSPSFAGRRQEAAALLDGASNKAAQGDRSLDMDLLAAARRDADQAIRALEQLASDAESLLGEAHAARGEAARKLDAARQEAEQALSAVSDLDPFPPRLDRGVKDLKRKLDQVDQRRMDADQAELENLTESLKKSTRTLRSRSARPPRALTEAVQAFLDHEFQSALDLLESSTFKNDRARYHASLLRAACYHGLFVVGGMQDPTLQSAAKEQILVAKSLNEQGKLGKPGNGNFSPSFLALWQVTVDSTAADELSAEAEDSETSDEASEDPL